MKDAKYYDLREDFGPVGFFPEMQDPRPDQFTEIVIRSRAPLEMITGAVKRNLEELFTRRYWPPLASGFESYRFENFEETRMVDRRGRN